MSYLTLRLRSGYIPRRICAMPPIQRCSRQESNNSHDGLVDVNAADQRSIEPQKVQEETANGINNQVSEEEVTRLQTLRESTRNPKKQEHVGKVPNGFVEKQRVIILYIIVTN